jgi:hypothetical protein
MRVARRLPSSLAPYEEDFRAEAETEGRREID